MTWLGYLKNKIKTLRVLSIAAGQLTHFVPANHFHPHFISEYLISIKCVNKLFVASSIPDILYNFGVGHGKERYITLHTIKDSRSQQATQLILQNKYS